MRRVSRKHYRHPPDCTSSYYQYIISGKVRKCVSSLRPTGANTPRSSRAEAKTLDSWVDVNFLDSHGRRHIRGESWGGDSQSRLKRSQTVTILVEYGIGLLQY